MAEVDSNTKLLVHFDGDDGDTTATDESATGHILTAVGDAQIDTDQSVFGGASSIFDDSVDAWSIPDSAEWDFFTSTTNPFTIECRLRLSHTGSQAIVDHYQDNNNFWYCEFSGSVLRIFGLRGGATKTYFRCSWSPSIDTWYHIAFVRSASARFIFIDGVEQTLTLDTNLAATALSGTLQIGTNRRNGGFLSGWIDEPRISDVARWTSGFTPPSEAYGPSGPPPPPPPVYTDSYHVEPQIPRRKKRKTNPGFSVTPGMHVPVPIKLDKWAHIYNTLAKKKKRNIANVTQNILVQFNTPTAPEVIMDSWHQQQQLARIKKRGNPSAHVDIDFIEAIQEQNGNFFDTGVFAFQIRKESTDQADFLDNDTFDFTIEFKDREESIVVPTAIATAPFGVYAFGGSAFFGFQDVEDFQLEDDEAFDFKIHYPEVGNEVFNSGVPGFVSANVIIDGVNESNMMTGTIVVTREDNTAARFRCNLELDQTLVPLRKPSELINKIVNISFSAAGMDGIVADYIPIFTGICKRVIFSDDQQSMTMSGYDYGGVHQTKGEFVSDNVTDVLSGSIYISSAGTHSLGRSPIWGIIWTGNNAVTDGQDYFINTLNGEIIVPISSRILQFPGAFTYNYQDPFDSMKEIIQSVATLKGWTLQEDNVTIEDYSSAEEHPVLSLSDESVIDVCRKFLELSGAKVESNLFPNLRVYSEVQNVINTVNTHTVDESEIFENTLDFTIDFDNILNEQTTRSVQKINANVVIGSEVSIGEFSANKPSVNPFTVQTGTGFVWDLNLGLEAVLAEHRIQKAGLNSISFSSSGRFHLFHTFEQFEETIGGASWTSFIDGDDFVIQLKHKVEVIGGGGVLLYAYPAVEYELTVLGSRINYGDGAIEDIKIVTAQRPIGGILQTLKGDVYENAYIETDQHCANICDAILLEHGNPYTVSFRIPLFVGKDMNIGDRIDIERDSNTRFSGIIKKLIYSINLANGENSILVDAKGVGFGI